jgi:phenylacetate-CoA ligase
MVMELPLTPEGASPLARLRWLLWTILPTNAFYAEKFAAAGWDRQRVRQLEALSDLPFTTKQELMEDQTAHPPYGRNLTYPVGQYVRPAAGASRSAGWTRRATGIGC